MVNELQRAYDALQIDSLEAVDQASDVGGFNQEQELIIGKELGRQPSEADLEAVRQIALAEYMQAIGRC